MNASPLIIDSNLLVLFVVGTASRDYIAKHKRLNEFTETDYDILRRAIMQAPSVLVTPNTLTETSNLAAYIGEPARSHILGVLGQLVEACEERYLSSATAVRRPEFLRLGLTDAALLEAASGEAALLTTDLSLYLAALGKGAQAFNFNHLRDAYLR